MTVYQRCAVRIGLSIALGAIPAAKAGADQHGPTKSPFEILEMHIVLARRPAADGI